MRDPETVMGDYEEELAKRLKAESERDAAREALRKYGSHLPGCWHSAYHGCWSSSESDPPCTCGFEEILKEIPK